MPDIPEFKTCEFSTSWPPDQCGKPAAKAYCVGTMLFYITCDNPNHDAVLHQQALEVLHEVASGEPDVILFDAASNKWLPQSTGN